MIIYTNKNTDKNTNGTGVMGQIYSTTPPIDY